MVSLSFRSHYGPGVNSASNRNEYRESFLGGKGGRCVGLTTLPPLCADCLKTWEPRPPGALRAFLGLYGTALPYKFKITHAQKELKKGRHKEKKFTEFFVLFIKFISMIFEESSSLLIHLYYIQSCCCILNGT
jgi:hypothetical protein